MIKYSINIKNINNNEAYRFKYIQVIKTISHPLVIFIFIELNKMQSMTNVYGVKIIKKKMHHNHMQPKNKSQLSSLKSSLLLCYA